MDRELLRAVAADTIEITAKGKYLCEGREVILPDEDYSDVIVLSPDTLERIKESDGHEIRRNENDLKCYLFNADSFEAARLLSEKPLVMNFANAHTWRRFFERSQCTRRMFMSAKYPI